MALEVGSVITFFEGFAENLFSTIDQVEKRIDSLKDKEFNIGFNFNEAQTKSFSESIEKIADILENRLTPAIESLERNFVGVLDNIQKKTLQVFETSSNFSAAITGVSTALISGAIGIGFSENSEIIKNNVDDIKDSIFSTEKKTKTIRENIDGVLKTTKSIGVTIFESVKSGSFFESFIENSIESILSKLNFAKNQFLSILPDFFNSATVLSNQFQNNDFFGFIKTLFKDFSIFALRVGLPLQGLISSVFVIPNIISGFSKILNLGRSYKGVLDRAKDTLIVINDNLTRNITTSANLVTAYSLGAATLLSPFTSILTVIPFINSFSKVLAISVQKRFDKFKAFLGDGRARLRLIVEDLKDLIERILPILNKRILSNIEDLEKINKLSKSIKTSTEKSQKEFEKTGKNLDKFRTLQSISRLKFPLSSQLQIFILELKPFIDQITLTITKVQLIVTQIFSLIAAQSGVAQSKIYKVIDGIDKQAQKTVDGIAKKSIQSGQEFEKLAKTANKSFSKVRVPFIGDSIRSFTNFFRNRSATKFNFNQENFNIKPENFQKNVREFQKLKDSTNQVIEPILKVKDGIKDLEKEIRKISRLNFSNTKNNFSDLNKEIRKIGKINNNNAQGNFIFIDDSVKKLNESLIRIEKEISKIINQIETQTRSIINQINVTIGSIYRLESAINRIEDALKKVDTQAAKTKSNLPVVFDQAKKQTQEFANVQKQLKNISPLQQKPVVSPQNAPILERDRTERLQLFLSSMRLGVTIAGDFEKTLGTGIKETVKAFVLLNLSFENLTKRLEKTKRSTLTKDLRNELIGFAGFTQTIIGFTRKGETTKRSIEDLLKSLFNSIIKFKKEISNEKIKDFEIINTNSLRINQENLKKSFLNFISELNSLRKKIGLGDVKFGNNLGNELVKTIANAIKSGEKDIIKVLEALAQLISDYFPRSPAKRGALKGIIGQGAKIPLQIASGINKSVGAVKKSASFLASTFSDTFRKGTSQASAAIQGSIGEQVGFLQITKDIVDIKGIRDNVSEINLLSDTLGLSTEELSALDFAAKTVNSSVNDLTFSFRSVSEKIVEGLQNPSSDFVKSLEKMGIRFFDIAKSTNPAITTINIFSDILKNADQNSEEFQTALETLGLFSGSKLIALLRKGSEGISELKSSAIDLGAVFSKEFGDSSEKLLSLNRQVESIADSLRVQFLQNIFPVLQESSENIIKFVTKNRLSIFSILQISGQAVASFIRFIRSVFIFIVKEPSKALDILIATLKSFGDFALGFLGNLFTFLTSNIHKALFNIFISGSKFIGIRLNNIFKTILQSSLEFIINFRDRLIIAIKVVAKSLARTTIAFLTKNISDTSKLAGIDIFKIFGIKEVSINPLENFADELKNSEEQIRKTSFEASKTAKSIVEDFLQIKESNEDYIETLARFNKETQESFNIASLKSSQFAIDMGKTIDKLKTDLSTLSKDTALDNFLIDFSKIISKENLDKTFDELQKTTKENIEKIEGSSKTSAKRVLEFISSQSKGIFSAENDGENINLENLKLDTSNLNESLKDVLSSNFDTTKISESRKEIEKIQENFSKINERYKSFIENTKKSKQELQGNTEAIKEIDQVISEVNKKYIEQIQINKKAVDLLSVKQIIEENSEALTTINSLLEENRTENEKIVLEYEKQIEQITRLQTAINNSSLDANIKNTFANQIEQAINIASTKLFEQLNAKTLEAINSAISTGFKQFIDTGKVNIKEIGGIFSGLLEDSITRVTDFAKKSFSQIAQSLSGIFGANGQFAAEALQGIVGLGGLLLSRLESEANVVRENIESAIDQTEQLRGVIAGDKQIGIQEVVTRITTANQPIVSELVNIKDILRDIRENTSRGFQNDSFELNTI